MISKMIVTFIFVFTIIFTILILLTVEYITDDNKTKDFFVSVNHLQMLKNSV